MKKINYLFVVIGALVFASCVNEQLIDNGEGPNLSGKEIAFVFGGTATRSVDAIESVEQETGVTLSLGTDDAGTEYFLNESVVDLNTSGIATRGIPIYDENITSIEEYKSFKAIAKEEDGNEYGPASTGEFSSMNQQKEVDGRNGWVYVNYYGGEAPWPDNNTSLYFYLQMPTSYVSNHTSSTTLNSSNGKIEFDYTSPLKGDDQKDMLFSSTKINKSTYDQKYKSTGAPVTLYHALTAVKFRVGNDNTGSTKPIITKVAISGLKDSGHCIVTPSEGKVEWPTVSESGNNGPVTMSFDNPTYVPTDGANNKDGSITYNASDNKFGATWYASETSNTNNLNNADGSKTFWLVPQVIPDNAKLTITFVVKTPDTAGEYGGGEITHTIDNFGAKLKKGETAVEWKAGQLRTYTLVPEDVNVGIFDQMSGLEKDNLHVTNTGNVPEFVRLMLIGNWYDKDGNILVGYKYKTEAEAEAAGEPYNTMVDPWFREDAQYAQYFDVDITPRTFDGTRPLGDDNKWTLGTGSYFYYTESISPGKVLSGTEALFQNYILPESVIPNIYLQKAGSTEREAAEGVHLVMEVVVQAISTVNPETNKEFSDWKAAWTYATKQNIKEK